MNDELEAAVTLSRLPGVGARGFIELIRKHALPSVALAAWTAAEESRAARRTPAKAKQAGPVDGWAKRARMAGATAAWAGGPGYPARLLDLSEPPPVVFMRGSWREPPDAPAGNVAVSPGDISELKYNERYSDCRRPVRRLCIVGARRAVPEACACLSRLMAGMGRSPHGREPAWEILSGAAAGIDSTAHRAALENGMRTSAVLANGIDIAYPACNKALIEEIAGSGGLLTELLPGSPPRRSFFPTRNRLLAALADAVIVVQAGEKSGSLITAKWAAKLGRPLYVFAPLSETPDWAGNRALLASGAILLDACCIDIDIIESGLPAAF